MSGYFVARATRGHVDGIQGWGGGGGGEVSSQPRRSG